MGPLRAHVSAAPLKHNLGAVRLLDLAGSPRSCERGPVEAREEWHCDRQVVDCSPRSCERGPVEA